MKPYFELLRVHHYVKNLLIFIPVFFSQNFLDPHFFLAAFTGFVCFSLTASIVYILNDIRDIEKDRAHSKKRNRPLPSGRVTKRAAILLAGGLALAIAAIIAFWSTRSPAFHPAGWTEPLLLATYMTINIGYSLAWKNVPILDVAILAAGFVLRVIFGAIIIDVAISPWLYLTIIVGSFYMGFGKRRNEIQKETGKTREVNRRYSHNFLDKNMYLCMALSVVFYSLWTISDETVARFGSKAFLYTVPLFIIILMKYSLNIERASDGDPTSVILKDKYLVGLVLLFGALVFLIANSRLIAEFLPK
ncbi:MAG: UbiA prenyltransferase family protein [Puniceicoccales bacterium]|jgi:4-hydroxybenzoate polyprenyltransferase|nr:UbiA prenyltransferase family protein [Puniceicoccales bacterium]